MEVPFDQTTMETGMDFGGPRGRNLDTDEALPLPSAVHRPILAPFGRGVCSYVTGPQLPHFKVRSPSI